MLVNFHSRLYLTRGEQEAVGNLITLVREELVQRAAAVLARLSQAQQVDVYSLAHDVLHHYFRLPSRRTSEQLP